VISYFPVRCSAFDQFGPLSIQPVQGNSWAPRNRPALRWRNTYARHPDVLAAQRRERARIRSERQQRGGRPKIKAP
jgi:hypothetical protein